MNNAAAFAALLQRRQAPPGGPFFAPPPPAAPHYARPPLPPQPPPQQWNYYQPQVPNQTAFSPYPIWVSPPSPAVQSPVFGASGYPGISPHPSYGAPRSQWIVGGPKPVFATKDNVIEKYVCEPCDKEFSQKSQYSAHTATHELCRFEGCSFSASKKVVSSHFHSVHGAYSGSGIKVINVEGQHFKVLMGTNPEEVEQWRAERRKKFPTKDSASLKRETAARVESAGGLGAGPGPRPRLEACNQGADEDRSGAAEPSARVPVSSLPPADEARDQQRRKPKTCFLFLKSKCKNGDECKYSHETAEDAKRSADIPLCTKFNRGNCQFGSSCRFIHMSENEPKSTGKRKAGGLEIPAEAAGRSEKKKKVGGLNLPAPLGSAGTGSSLLKKLLEEQVNEEENIILQCIRLLNENNYLQKFP